MYRDYRYTVSREFAYALGGSDLSYDYRGMSGDLECFSVQLNIGGLNADTFLLVGFSSDDLAVYSVVRLVDIGENYQRAVNICNELNINTTLSRFYVDRERNSIALEYIMPCTEGAGCGEACVIALEKIIYADIMCNMDKLSWEKWIP